MNPFRLLRSILPLAISTHGTSGPKLLAATSYHRLRRLAAKGEHAITASCSSAEPLAVMRTYQDCRSRL
jgi:hypothetical protein